MIVIKIMGGLGNQMFQYAYAKALHAKGYAVKLDLSFIQKNTAHHGFGLEYYGIDLESASIDDLKAFNVNGLLRKFFNRFNIPAKHYITEKTLLFSPLLASPNDSVYIEGYFQTERYFKDIKELLLQQFQLRNPLSAYTQKIQQLIEYAPYSISLHVRRGDYLNASAQSYHGLCSLEYYQNAMHYLNEYCQDRMYVIFSDDIAWVKENMPIENALYICDEGQTPHEDMYLMSLCQHNIIANSSFSWWGAWLNQNPHKIVIAPKQWFANAKMQAQSQDIVPDEWIRL
ncbi:MAG: alpha-1,2-fucosyltransferase [Sulfurospirillaceae bacterium]|nr:alpha-1,2-fucosyltransferase [Sulfurospirillaceae bacterium]MDD2826334.1 alpha-1,2-fucosyltransferase [Sulfurospirillaceae bacterium]